MIPGGDLTNISHAIQLAVAPVFLFTGIVGLLGVIGTRLARVIDRAQDLSTGWPALDEGARARARGELGVLERRRKLCSLGVNLSITAAFLICLVIVTLFLDAFLGVRLTLVASLLFMASLAFLSAALVAFKREVTLALHAVSFDPAHFG
jgi:hypothetical protein